MAKIVLTMIQNYLFFIIYLYTFRDLLFQTLYMYTFVFYGVLTVFDKVIMVKIQGCCKMTLSQCR